MMAVARRSSARLVIAVVAAAVVLGVLSTAALGTFGGPFGLGRPGWWASGPAEGRSPGCPAPALPGSVVNVSVADMGSMMGGYRGDRGDWGAAGPGGMMGGYWGGPREGRSWWPGMGMGRMNMAVSPVQARAGQVSLRVDNIGWRTHEVVVLPLAAGQAVGQRPVGPDGKIDESGSLGEVSGSCVAGSGDGIVSGATGWATLTLAPGRYELVCNLRGHYAAGMYAELDVTT